MRFLVSLLTLSLYVVKQYTCSIRLVDGSSSSEGRVEIYYNGEWGTVCDDSFNCGAAIVACRQLGYSTGVSLGNSVINGQGTIWLDDVTCSGSESSIAGCSHRGWGFHNCGHHEDVGVRCIRFEDSCAPTSGGWSLWSEWSTCTITCGGGFQRRSRDCNNPRPSYGGSYCVGVSVANQVCNRECCRAPVNGGWSNWLEWSTCSATCGGLQHRSRDCKNPLPRDGGKYCEDVSFDNRVCNNDCCIGKFCFRQGTTHFKYY